MVDLQIAGWQIRCDRDATSAAYLEVPRGAHEACSCLYCKNYGVVFARALPDSARRLFDELGIDSAKPAETTEYGPDQGLILYGAWWHFVGHVVADPGNQLTLSGDLGQEPFNAFFAERSDLAHHALSQAGKLVQLELTMHLPWSVPEPYPHPT